MFLENFSSLVNEGIFALILRDNELNDKLSCHVHQSKTILRIWFSKIDYQELDRECYEFHIVLFRN